MEKDGRERLPAAGVQLAESTLQDDAEDGPARKRARRSKGDGVKGLQEFKD